jgi:hypothetical protein
MIEKYPDFWNIILGNGSLGAFLAYLVIAYVSAIVSLLLEASKRDIASSNTPVKFSYRFLFAANTKRLIANFLAVPLLIRLVYEYGEMKWMILVAITIGVIIDRAAMWLKNIGVLTSNKAAARVAQQIGKDDLTVIKP